MFMWSSSVVCDSQSGSPNHFIIYGIGIKVHTLPFKSLGWVWFITFYNGVSSAHQGCIYSFKNTEKTLIFWNIIAIPNIGFPF